MRHPPDKIDVSGPGDGKITKDNAAQAVSDLVPDPTGGYAARTKFYSSALSTRHENVHLADYRKTVASSCNARLAKIAAIPSAELSWQAEVVLHKATSQLREIAGDLIESYAGPGKRTAAECREVDDMAAYAARPGERAAFLDGKPHYQALAEGIAKRFGIPVVARTTPIKQGPSPDDEPATTTREELIAYCQKGQKKLVEGLVKGDELVAGDLRRRTEAFRPLPSEVNAVLSAAWQTARTAQTPSTKALAAILGLRFGVEVNDGAPVDHYLQAWDALGKLPSHHVESPDAAKNKAGYNNWTGARKGDEDPLQKLVLSGQGKGGTAGGGKIDLTMDTEMANRMRFRRDRTSKVGEIETRNSGTLPADLGVSDAEAEELRARFEGAKVKNLSHSVLHEMGHSLDRVRGIMDGAGYNFPAWKPRDDEAPARIARHLGLDDDRYLGKDGYYRNDLVKGISSRGPAAIAEAREDGAEIMWKGRSKQIEQAKTSAGGEWLVKLAGAGGRAFDLEPVALDGRVYVFDAGADSHGKWSSYDHAYRKAHSVSDYQWKTHREYFAECYATYYDSTPPGALLEARDPQMKARLDALHVDSKIAPPKK